MGFADTPIHNMPIYPVVDAARYLHIPLGTLRVWLNGRTYKTQDGQQFSKPLIQRPNLDCSQFPSANLIKKQLSFTNLVEAHVLRVIREDHKIKLDRVRTALDYIEETLGIPHPLASARFETDGMDLFLDTIETFINVSRSGQLAMKKILKDLLTRIEWDEKGIATRLSPIVYSPNREEVGRLLYIDPRISFGRPTIAGTGIPTDVIVSRYNGGDEIEAIADDYNCKPDQVYAAIWFEESCLAA